MALSVAACDVQYFRDLLHDLGVYQSKATVLKADNKGANDLAHDYTKSSRSRHIQRRWFKVREFIHKLVVKVMQVPTIDNISDFFTKVLDRRTFEKFRDIIMGTPAPSVPVAVLAAGFSRTKGTRSVTFLRGLISSWRNPDR
jgi:hypothetical protein